MKRFLLFASIIVCTSCAHETNIPEPKPEGPIGYSHLFFHTIEQFDNYQIIAQQKHEENAIKAFSYSLPFARFDTYCIAGFTNATENDGTIYLQKRAGFSYYKTDSWKRIIFMFPYLDSYDVESITWSLIHEPISDKKTFNKYLMASSIVFSTGDDTSQYVLTDGNKIVSMVICDTVIEDEISSEMDAYTSFVRSIL